MPLILQLGWRSRSSPLTTGTFYCSDRPYATGSGGGGVPANLQLAPVIDLKSVKPVSEIIHQGSPREEITEIRLHRLLADDPTCTSALDNVEIEGYSAKLWYVGDVDQTTQIETYSLSNPLVLASGTCADGSAVHFDGVVVRIRSSPSPLHQFAMRELTGHGPAVLFPASSTARCAWEVYDPPGDLALSVRFWHSLEDWEGGGTQILASNGDFVLAVVDSQLKITVDHATTDAVVTAPRFSGDRPFERFYVARFEYTASTKTVELFLDAVSQGSNAGTGALVASGNAWILGADDAEAAGFLQGVAHTWSFWSTIPDAEDFEAYESGPLAGDESGLYAWLEGEMLSETALIDNAGAVNKTGGLVGIPATGHGFVAGQEVTITGTTNYDGVYVLDATTTTNEMVITATFTAETFAGTETAVASTTLYDKAQINTGSRRDAVVKGARRGTSLGGGGASSSGLPAGFPGTPTDEASGRILTWQLGSGRHVAGIPVDDSTPVFLHCDPLRGFQDFIRLNQGGPELTIASRVTSLLALYAASLSAGEAVVYPQTGLSRIESATRVEGLVAADVIGSAIGLRAWRFDGATSRIDFGVSENGKFITNWTVLADILADANTTAGVILSNDDLAGTGIYIALQIQSGGEYNLVARSSHNGHIASTAHAFPKGSAAASVAISETLVANGANTDFTVRLYVDGILSDSASDSVTTVNLAASTANLVAGAQFVATGVYAQFLTGAVCNLSIVSAVLSSTWIQDKFLEDIYPRLEAGGAAVDLGSGQVGIPIGRHPFVAGDVVWIDDTTNYSSKTYTLTSNTTDVLLAITETFAAETFDGTERVRPSSLAHHYPGRRPAGAVYPASTLADEVGSLDGTMTGGVAWRGGIGLTSPRALAAHVVKSAIRETPDGSEWITGPRIDLSKTSAYPLYPVDWSDPNRQATYAEILHEIGESWEMWIRQDPDGTTVLGHILDPSDQAADHVLLYARDIKGAEGDVWPDEHGPAPPHVLEMEYAHVHTTEDAGNLLEDTAEADRRLWAKKVRVANRPVPGARRMFPDSPTVQSPSGRTASRDIIAARWTTRAGAVAELIRRREIERNRRAVADPVALTGALWLLAASPMLAGDYVQVDDVPDLMPYASGLSVKGIVTRVTRDFDSGGVKVRIERIKMV